VVCVVVSILGCKHCVIGCCVIIVCARAPVLALERAACL